jgi:hypothetical protein
VAAEELRRDHFLLFFLACFDLIFVLCAEMMMMVCLYKDREILA